MVSLTENRLRLSLKFSNTKRRSNGFSLLISINFINSNIDVLLLLGFGHNVIEKK